jgi:hypothetical protein
VATTNAETENEGRQRLARNVLIGLVVLAAAVLVYQWWNRPPQMGTSEEVFNTVDALYTAVRNQNEKQVGACQARLKHYRELGQLPPDAADRLDRIVKKTRDGSWDSAVRELYEFMMAQRREGPREDSPEHSHDKKAGKTKGK